MHYNYNPTIIADNFMPQKSERYKLCQSLDNYTSSDDEYSFFGFGYSSNEDIDNDYIEQEQSNYNKIIWEMYMCTDDDKNKENIPIKGTLHTNQMPNQSTNQLIYCVYCKFPGVSKSKNYCYYCHRYQRGRSLA